VKKGDTGVIFGIYLFIYLFLVPLRGSGAACVSEERTGVVVEVRVLEVHRTELPQPLLQRLDLGTGEKGSGEGRDLDESPPLTQAQAPLW